MPASSPKGEALAADGDGCGFRTSFATSFATPTVSAGVRTVGGFGMAGGAVCPDADAAALAAIGAGAWGATTSGGAPPIWGTIVCAGPAGARSRWPRAGGRGGPSEKYAPPFFG